MRLPLLSKLTEALGVVNARVAALVWAVGRRSSWPVITSAPVAALSALMPVLAMLSALRVTVLLVVRIGLVATLPSSHCA